MDFLNSINDLLVNALGPLGPIYVLGGLAILMIVGVLPFMATRDKDPFERLDGSRKRNVEDEGPSLREKESAINLERFQSFLEPQDAEEMSAVKLKLRQAGYAGKESVRIYYFAQMVLGIGFLAAGFAYTMMTKGDGPLGMQEMVIKILLPGVVGYMAPKYWVTRRQGERQVEIAQGFPDSLDLMLVCVEAGQSLDQAIVRVAEELKSGFPALAEEYGVVALELKAGKDKTIVLRDFAERSGNDDIASFVAVLAQSQAYGTSVGEALRVYAAEMRDKRIMRAEEKANTLPTKLTLTTMMLTVPPLLIILMSPSVVTMSKAFGG